MPEINITELDRVETTLNYHLYTGERPAYYLYDPTPGPAPERPQRDKRPVSVFDVRDIMDALSLDENGFAVLRHTSSVGDFFDEALVRGAYYAETEALLKRLLDATRVQAFDHNVRNKPLSETDGSGIREPVRFAHNDYTETSGPQRVRDLMGEIASRLLEHRYTFINVWWPIRGPVLDVPLAVCDARSIEHDDFIATDLKYEDRSGEIYSLRHNAAHRWFYISQMQPNEVMLLKCFDSARDGRARYTAHSAFRDPAAPDDTPSRQSIEVRTIAFFAPDA